MKLVCGDTKVELFRDERTFFPAEYRSAVIAVVQDAEFCFPVHPPLPLDGKCQHLVLSVRTKIGRTEAQANCEAEIDRAITLLSAVVSPDLFRTLLFRGGLQGGPPSRDLGLVVKAIDPITIDSKYLSAKLAKAEYAVSRLHALRGRFEWMSRLVAKGLAEPLGEEGYIWLWTALEVFPMVGTSNIKTISEFLAGYLGESPSLVKEKLRIGWLFGMRSKLVHDGRLPVQQDGKFAALTELEHVVVAVVRHAAALLYDGALDRALGRTE